MPECFFTIFKNLCNITCALLQISLYFTYSLLQLFPIFDYALLQYIHDTKKSLQETPGMEELKKQKALAGKGRTTGWENDTDKKILRHVINSAPNESARIKFEGFGNSNYRSREVGEAFRSLDLAKLIRLVYPSTNLKPPIKTDFRKRPRLQFLDTGILNHSLNMQGEMIDINDMNSLHRGRITVILPDPSPFSIRHSTPPRHLPHQHLADIKIRHA